MSDESDFEDAVRICEFYAYSEGSIEVDLENRHIMVDGYGVDLVVENGQMTTYLVEDPDGVSLFVDDLDTYFQDVLDWEDRG